MLIQNHPHSKKIQDNIQFGSLEYLIISKDFNFKSQLIRSLEINADKSYGLIVESVFAINR